MPSRKDAFQRSKFDQVYDTAIIGAGFFETDEYYRLERERYWRTLEFFVDLPVSYPARILEIGAGQTAVICKALFGDDCVVGDISNEFSAPLDRQSIPLIECNLMSQEFPEAQEQFDVVMVLEVIEHLPVPPYVIFERIKRFLKPGGLIFITTPNLFRLRNLVRMIFGVEFLDRFMLPRPQQGLGHQLEYCAEHLRWQMEEAKLEVVLLEHDELGHVGHSPKARIARKLLSPLTVRPRWRDELVAAGRKI